MMSEYVTSECTRCGGTGERFDATCADRIDAGPYAGRCSACRGTGVISVLRSSIELRRTWDLEREARFAEQAIGESVDVEIPDWMLGWAD
jgi:DnaJ-class molecular chaperone